MGKHGIIQQKVFRGFCNCVVFVSVIDGGEDMGKVHAGRPPRLRTSRLNMALTEQEASNLAIAADLLGLSKAGVLREGLSRIVRQLKSQGRWNEAAPDAEGGAGKR